MNRGARVLRDGIAVTWLVAALVLSLAHRWVPAASWLMIHLVLLGALTHAALVWSEHFAHTLLRTLPDARGVRRQAGRTVLLALGSALVLVGVPSEIWWVVVAGAAAVTAAIVWHAAHLVLALRRALPHRFRVVTHYYVAAAAWLPVGAALGATLALGLDDAWHGRVVLAHLVANVLGWLGLTVTGTLLTFWPTMLRARMDDRAEVLARQALPLLLGGITVMVGGALAGLTWLALAGLAAYAGGLWWWGRALIHPLGAKGVREFAPASVGLALVWGGVGLVWIGAVLLTAGSWDAVGDAAPTLGGVLAVGFAAQLLFGALSYLVPSVMGGGPSVVRAGQAWFNRGTTWRLTVVNGGLVLWLLPAPSWVRVAVSVLVLAALAAFLPLLFGGARASARVRRTQGDGLPPPTVRTPGAGRDTSSPPSVWSVGQLVAGVTALVLAVTVGVGVDPAAAGLPPARAAASASGGEVEPSGRTTRVEVAAHGMRFTPARIEVARGDRLVIVLTNTDPTTAHDLAVGTARTPRLQPGESAELDVGVVGSSIRGWCTVAGHRQMGMVLDVVVAGEPAEPAAGEHATHTGAAAVPAQTDAVLPDAVDPVLAPLGDERIHRLTFTVSEVPLEVAPGLWQTRWTYNGRSVGPTLHGRVGDEFEITLVNDGTIGHSVDFHAGAVAPDAPMRTIAPGESLVYRFTAGRAGAWLYHCSTMPMSTHIAAGMHGAVIIEPDDLPAVDRSYVVVQSEVYLAGAATSPDAAAEVDADKVVAQTPDRVVFNGVANQYDQHPFAARVGERVRFWVVDAGPSRATAFHVVGGQFDTVWTEGAYTLRGGRDAFGSTAGGAQVLPLQPAQGGFVELTFGEAGHYPVVSHVMVDAERGAHGVVDVTG